MASSKSSASSFQGEINSKESRADQFSKDETVLITRMYNLVGERWSLIAGRIPRRTADEIKKYWLAKQDSYKQQ